MVIYFLQRRGAAFSLDSECIFQIGQRPGSPPGCGKKRMKVFWGLVIRLHFLKKDNIAASLRNLA
jgi:hypothetical protein